MDKAKKIIMTVVHLSYGGAETQVIQLSKELKNRGWTVAIVTMMPPSAWKDELNTLGIPIIDLGFKRGKPSLSGFLRYLRFVRSFNPSIIHAHTYNPNIMTRVGKLFVRGYKLICTPHNAFEGGKFRTIAYKATDPLCNLSTNVSKDAVYQYVKKGATPKSKMRLVYNGLCLDEFAKISSSHIQSLKTEFDLVGYFVWIAVGRLSEQKNFKLLVKAFKNIVEFNVKAKLLIVGVGEEEEELKELIAELDLKAHIKLLGGRKDIPALMAASDAFVLSSLWEGLPMVLLEAACSKLPAVVTKVGGNDEIYHDEQTGFFVCPNDREELASKMIKMMCIPKNQKQQMGENAFNHARLNFDIQNIVNQWEQIYTS